MSSRGPERPYYARLSLHSQNGLRSMTSLRARVYIFATVAAGAAVLGYGFWNWHTADWARYAFLLGVAGLASGMKVTLSAGAGTMSMNFLFILVGVQSLSLGETLLMGVVGILVQRFVRAKHKPTAVQVVFNVASIACSIGAAFATYQTGLKFGGLLEAPIVLLLAAGIFFLANTLSVALAIGLTEEKSPWVVWRVTYFWSFPNYLLSAAVAWTLGAVSKAFGWQVTLLVLPVLYVIYRSHRLYVDRLEEARERAEQQRIHAEELAALNRRTIETLALAIEAKDQNTHDHLARVEAYATEIGRELGLSENELKALEAAALLHDIGKLAVPEYIISKPGKLTPEEFEKMKIHPVVGAELLEQVQFPYPVAPIVRAHHEKWDGSGYPDGLSGEDIPIGARILSTVDCLDALASDRQYRRALPLEEALAVVQKESGKSFDPRVVEVLSRRYVELERKAKASSMGQREKLSIDIKVERGAAPAAGFEETTADLMNFHRALEGTDESALLELLEEQFTGGTPSQVFAVLCDHLARAIPYHVLVIYLRQGDQLVPEFLDGDAQQQFASLAIPLGMGLAGWVAEHHKSIINGNPSVEPGYLNDPTKFSTLGSALAVPLEFPGGPCGVLSLYRRDRNAFHTGELNLLRLVATRVGRVLDLVSHPQ
jgi:putative nucleotidyltransferase with HDIG domain